ncbi:hypothetical protein HLB23_28745 [Nocardia uniformis]|uniref:Uncharacterized protein n=1 Tax=Nocardia uniformis TaxID=53432 RepID=A0A849C7P1_9NOCA|nr:hypothetical protein [Nocardia uniformis]NNH73796.1 hypothetical protein [Nocardia uniformis]
MSGMHWSEVLGLRVDIYRSLHGTKTGITASHDQLTVVGIVDETDGGRVLPMPLWRQSRLSTYAPAVVVHIEYRWRLDGRQPPLKYAYLTPLQLDPSEPAVYFTAHGGNYAGGTPMLTDPLEPLLGYPPGHLLPVHDHNPF